MTNTQIELLKQKDNRTFERLFNLVFHHIRFFCERIVLDKQEAEDIAIQSFTKYYELSGNFNSFNEIKSFLYTIARNACLNYLTRRKVQDKYKRQVITPFSENDQLQMEYYAYEAALMEKIYAEIENLPNQCREVFKLCYLQRLPRTEVAVRMNITVSTVHRHCAIAVNKLKLIISQKECLY